MLAPMCGRRPRPARVRRLLIVGVVVTPVMQASIAVWGVTVLVVAAAPATKPMPSRSAVISI